MKLLLGGGAYAREIAAVFDGPWSFVDPYARESTWRSWRIYKSLKDAMTDFPHASGIPAIADPMTKMRLADEAQDAGLSIAVPLVHQGAYVHSTAVLGKGSVVYPTAAISHSTQLAECVAVLFHCSVGHDVVLGRGTTLSPSVAISGNVTVGERVFFGTNCCIREKVSIGADCRVGMGAIVTESLEARINALVNPRLMKLPVEDVKP